MGIYLTIYIYSTSDKKYFHFQEIMNFKERELGTHYLTCLYSKFLVNFFKN
jgi:hypothetical protein